MMRSKSLISGIYPSVGEGRGSAHRPIVSLRPAVHTHVVQVQLLGQIAMCGMEIRSDSRQSIRMTTQRGCRLLELHRTKDNPASVALKGTISFKGGVALLEAFLRVFEQ